MAFIPLMMASPFPKVHPDFSRGNFVAEEKFDGIRLGIEVDRQAPTDLFCPYTIRSWSRNGILHAIPKHLQTELGKLPTGYYDGELFVPGKRSFGATRLDQALNLKIVIFDILSLMGEDTTDLALRDRRKLLGAMFEHEHCQSQNVTLAEQVYLLDRQHLATVRDKVWDRDGEGLIIKDLNATYKPGKRPKNVWIKVKQLHSAVLEVIGFEPSKGEIVNRGPYATVILRDEEGVVTTVKTLNDAELANFERLAPIGRPHPAIGRKLRIEYQERTTDRSYRHPRWDRWEDE